MHYCINFYFDTVLWVIIYCVFVKKTSNCYLVIVYFKIFVYVCWVCPTMSCAIYHAEIIIFGINRGLYVNAYILE